MWFFSRHRAPSTVNCNIVFEDCLGFLVCRINLTVPEYEEDNVRVKFICQGQYPTVKVKVVQRDNDIVLHHARCRNVKNDNILNGHVFMASKT